MDPCRAKVVTVERENDRKSRLVECGDLVLDLEHFEWPTSGCLETRLAHFKAVEGLVSSELWIPLVLN